jgi:N,N'-diacetyllegionaminate synthase
MARIIAECCQNHNGDLAVLKDMIWSAAEAGADFVKIQSMLSDELAFRERFEVGLEVDGVRKAIKRPYGPEYERLKALDLDDEAHSWFIEECERAGIEPMTTVFTRSRVPFLAGLRWNAIKVASYDCASPPLLHDLKQCFDHIFISTGATYDAEIEQTAALLGDHPFTLLHCVTIYPTPLDVMNLARLQYLSTLAPSVGFSDHSLTERDGNKASIVAMMHGADVIERHYSVLPSDRTKDGAVSIDPTQLAELVRFAGMPSEELEAHVVEQIPGYEAMTGDRRRELTPEELLNRDYYRGRFASRVNDEAIYNWEEGRAGFAT